MTNRELLLMYGRALAANGILLEMLTGKEDDQIIKAVRDAYGATQRLVITLQVKESELKGAG